MATDINKKSSKGGRKPKLSKSIHRYAFRLTDEENSKFLSLYDPGLLITLALSLQCY